MPILDRPSLALNLFKRITEGDSVAILRAMVESEPRATENEWTEFKAFPYAEYKDVDKDYSRKNLVDPKKDFIKETWSEVLSSFANSGGGVLIWGIHAAKRDGVDEAHNFQLVPNPKALASRLTELHHDATDPPLSGVQIVAFPDAEAGGKGFVVCYVPQGQFVPYRAEYADKQYYIRTGDSSIIPIRVVLQRLFYPQSLARLRMSVVLKLKRSTTRDANNTDLEYSIIMVNDGTASAHDVYVVAYDDITYPVTGAGLINSENWARTSLSPNKSMFHAKVPIHPGFATEVASSHTWRVPHQYVVGNSVFPDFNPITMRIHVFSRDADFRSFQVGFNKEDFQTATTVEKVCAETTP